MGQVILNYITPNAWHPFGQARLKESLDRVGWAGDTKLFTSNDFHCTPHSKVPYGFKAHILDWAWKANYDQVIWVDASFWAVRNLDSLFDKIKQEGILIQNSGYPLGQWASDDSLAYYKLSRDDMMTNMMYSGGFVGLDLTQEKAQNWLTKFYRAAVDGRCFKGSWTNRNNEVSTDPRCKGHRHDMIVGTVLLNQMGQTIQPNNSIFSYYGWWTEHQEVQPYFLIEGGTRKI